jgi:tetratricopeptide (TPR) repeat protein
MNAHRSLLALLHFWRFVSRSGLLAGVLLAVIAGPVSAQGYYNEAHDYYQGQVEGKVKVTELHLPPCQRYLSERDYFHAFSDCLFILKIFPNHPYVLSLMAQICERWNSPKCQFDDFFEKAVSINPGASATYLVGGIHLHRTHQYAQAIQSFKQALEINPNSQNAHYDLGLTYLETKQFELANQHAQRAYGLGAPLPGLRKRLEQAGYWKPIDQNLVAEPQAGLPRSQGAAGRADDTLKK